MSKSKQFQEQFEKFLTSDKTVEDYMMLFIILRTVTAPGDGILWREVEDIVTDALNKTEACYAYM